MQPGDTPVRVEHENTAADLEILPRSAGGTLCCVSTLDAICSALLRQILETEEPVLALVVLA